MSDRCWSVRESAFEPQCCLDNSVLMENMLSLYLYTLRIWRHSADGEGVQELQ